MNSKEKGPETLRFRGLLECEEGDLNRRTSHDPRGFVGIVIADPSESLRIALGFW